MPVIRPSAGVALQVLSRAAAALRCHGEGAELVEAAGVQQVGHVLARAAQAAGVPPRDGLRPGGVPQQGAPLQQTGQLSTRRLQQVGRLCSARGFAARRALSGCRRHAPLHQHRAFFHHLAHAAQHVHDLGVRRAGQGQLHLHGLQHQQHLLGTANLPRHRVHGHDRAPHGRAQVLPGRVLRGMSMARIHLRTFAFQ